MSISRNFSVYSDLVYGFNQYAQVSLNISKLTAKTMVFGLATKKEIKFIESLKSCFEYCDGEKKIITNSIFNFK